MPETQTRLSPVYELKRANVNVKGVFTGYASTFLGQPDSYGDVIAPGAFQHSLDKHKSDGSTPALLWSHSPADPIGKWTQLREDNHGLKVSGKLTLDTVKGAEAYSLMKDDALGLSIGFKTELSKYDSVSKTNILQKLQLFEVSLVSVPANPQAKIIDVKSSVTSVREFEDVIREIGYSKRAAKIIAKSGWSALAERGEESDLDDEQLNKMVAAIEARSTELKSLLTR